MSCANITNSIFCSQPPNNFYSPFISHNETQVFTNYYIFVVHVIAGKPNSKYDSEDGDEDPHFKKIIERANQEPTKKFTTPQTEAQEIGWVTRPLVSVIN